MRFLHTMLRVRNLDAALQFYCNLLGLEEGEGRALRPPAGAVQAEAQLLPLGARALDEEAILRHHVEPGVGGGGAEMLLHGRVRDVGGEESVLGRLCLLVPGDDLGDARECFPGNLFPRRPAGSFRRAPVHDQGPGLGVEPDGRPTAEFAKFLQADIARWTAIAKAANIKAD